jgi:hypothetical protein
MTVPSQESDDSSTVDAVGGRPPATPLSSSALQRLDAERDWSQVAGGRTESGIG